MNTRIVDTSLSPESMSGHMDAFSKNAYRTHHDANSRTRSNNDRERSDDDTQAADASGKKNTVSTEDARHFEAAMRSDEQRSKGRDTDSSSDQDSDTPEKEARDEDVSSELSFASLFAGRFDAAAVTESAKVEQPAESSQRAESLAEHLAERILVSESSVAGQEVRIQPSRDILPDTEICLVRGADGLLSAVIHTDNPSTFQTLAAAQHDLRARLEQSEGQTVYVELRSSADDDNDPRRRSRGLDLYPQS